MAQLLNTSRQVHQFSSTTDRAILPTLLATESFILGRPLPSPTSFLGISKSKLASAQNQFDLLYPPGHDGYM